MSTVKQVSSSLLISPTSTTSTNLNAQFDNSDQGSVDSDYTSLESSKSSLHRQGRSQSIDELASTNITQTNIPTRHFLNGTSQKAKSIIDPLQFVKIQPNHELVERANEQLSLSQSRQRLKQTYKLTTRKVFDDDETDWSKAVENWRIKREQKRLKNGQNSTNDIAHPKIPSSPKNEETEKSIENCDSKTEEKLPPTTIKEKSPSPEREKSVDAQRQAPSKLRQITIEKTAEARGFGFKIDGGKNGRNPIFVSNVEKASPADKFGLLIDDEIVGIDGKSIENLTFEQVRKLIKERSFTGKIQLAIRTFTEPTKNNETENKSPVYTFLPVNSPTMNFFAPKPFRSTQNETEKTAQPEKFSQNEIFTLMNALQTSPIEAFRKMIDPSNQPRSNQNQTIYDKELQELEAEFEKQLQGIEESSKNEKKTSTQVIINLHENLAEPNKMINKTIDPIESTRFESPIAQVRSYVEKQMDQLQQELEFGFSRTQKNPIQNENFRPTLKKSLSTYNEIDPNSANRNFGLEINPNEEVVHYLEPFVPQRPLSAHIKRSFADLSTTKFNGNTSTLPQKKVTIQLAEDRPIRQNQSSLKKSILDENERRTTSHRPLYNHLINEQTIPSIRHRPKSQSRTSNCSNNRSKSPFRFNRNQVPSVSGRLRCSRCNDELGQGSAMVIESLGLYYHIECFRCFVCNIPLTSSYEGTDVRVRTRRLHCPNCFSDENGLKLSAV